MLHWGAVASRYKSSFLRPGITACRSAGQCQTTRRICTPGAIIQLHLQRSKPVEFWGQFVQCKPPKNRTLIIEMAEHLHKTSAFCTMYVETWFSFATFAWWNRKIGLEFMHAFKSTNRCSADDFSTPKGWRCWLVCPHLIALQVAVVGTWPVAGCMEPHMGHANPEWLIYLLLVCWWHFANSFGNLILVQNPYFVILAVHLSIGGFLWEFLWHFYEISDVYGIIYGLICPFWAQFVLQPDKTRPLPGQHDTLVAQHNTHRGRHDLCWPKAAPKVWVLFVWTASKKNSTCHTGLWPHCYEMNMFQTNDTLMIPWHRKLQNSFWRLYLWTILATFRSCFLFGSFCKAPKWPCGSPRCLTHWRPRVGESSSRCPERPPPGHSHTFRLAMRPSCSGEESHQLFETSVVIKLSSIAYQCSVLRPMHRLQIALHLPIPS